MSPQRKSRLLRLSYVDLLKIHFQTTIIEHELVPREKWLLAEQRGKPVDRNDPELLDIAASIVVRESPNWRQEIEAGIQDGRAAIHRFRSGIEESTECC